MKEIPRDVPDVTLIAPYVRQGLVNRVLETGKVPERGPGRYRIANIMSRIRQPERLMSPKGIVSPEDNKGARRAWNLGNIMSRHRNR